MTASRIRLHETVVRHVEDELAAGRLPVGSRLPGERALAEQLGISRASVREGIRVLEAMGVVRPAYRELHRDAGLLLGCRSMTILGASRDAAEATPFRSSTLLRIVDGMADDLFVPAQPEPRAYPLAGMTSLEYWRGVWTGAVCDERARQIIVATAATALLTLKKGNASRYEACLIEAGELWDARRKSVS